MYISDYGNPILFIINSAIGIVGTVFIAFSIKKNKLLEFYGKNSLIILFTRFPVKFILVKISSVLLGESNLWQIAFSGFILTCITVYFIALFISRYAPCLTGKIKIDNKLLFQDYGGRYYMPNMNDDKYSTGYFVSVIIPVYNIEKYIRRCIDSIINQTMEEIEIIIVDDGSTDESGKICDEYAAKDSRIHVFHKSNAGLSSARNDGIRMSTAPFIMFVDGDDWVEPDYCELPYKMACKNNADLVLFSYRRVFNDGRVSGVETNRKSGVLTEAEAIHYNSFVVWAVWVGLYSRKIFDNVQFPDGKLHEDTGTSHRFIHEANKICLLNKILYDYRVDRSGSIMNDSTTRDHPDLREMLVRKSFDLFDWGYQDLAKIYALRALVRYGLQHDDVYKLDKILKTGKIPSFWDWKNKTFCHLYRISPIIFSNVCNLKGKRKKCMEFFQSLKKRIGK